MKSNGRTLRSSEWRANRLADGLAKAAANRNAAPSTLTQLIASAEVLVRHSAALLGSVTYAANNHPAQRTTEDGRVVKYTVRDVIEPPRKKATGAEGGTNDNGSSSSSSCSSSGGSSGSSSGSEDSTHTTPASPEQPPSDWDSEDELKTYGAFLPEQVRRKQAAVTRGTNAAAERSEQATRRHVGAASLRTKKSVLVAIYALAKPYLTVPEGSPSDRESSKQAQAVEPAAAVVAPQAGTVSPTKQSAPQVGLRATSFNDQQPSSSLAVDPAHCHGTASRVRESFLQRQRTVSDTAGVRARPTRASGSSATRHSSAAVESLLGKAKPRRPPD